MAVGRKTGGRTKGTPNKTTQALQAQADAARKSLDEAGAATPLDVMLAVMRNPELAVELRFEAAKAAAPYLHPRLASVEHSGPDRGPILTETREMTDLELARMIGRLLTKVVVNAPGLRDAV